MRSSEKENTDTRWNRGPGHGPLSVTPRQMEVLYLLIIGRKGREIAKALKISPNTVNRHKLALFEKLQVTRSVQLIRLAVEHGWVRYSRR